MRIKSVTPYTRSLSLPDDMSTRERPSRRRKQHPLEPHLEVDNPAGPTTPPLPPPPAEIITTPTRIIITTAEEEEYVTERRSSRSMSRSSIQVESSGAHDANNYTSVHASDTSLFPDDGVQSSRSLRDLDLEAAMARRPSVPMSVMLPVIRRGRQFGESQAARKSTRLVEKNGHSNVTITKASRKKRRYIRDFFTTIMDMQLRYHIFLFVSAFVVSWVLFAAGWLAIALSNGDMPLVNTGDNSTDECLVNIYDYSTALLFSIEMQTTVGFGYRLVGSHCPIATMLMMCQSIFGIFLQCFITGIIFAKIARPLRRAKTIVFSRSAVVCVRDGFYNLVFRVGDLRKTHIIGTSIRALLVRSRETSEGELIPLCQYPLDLVTESSITDSFVFCFWPVTVAHRITSSSPLWRLSAESLLTDRFEVIVILEGTAQTSGALLQVKTSYIPGEIRWGQRLTPLLTTQRSDGEYEIDFSNFHDTVPVAMPDCSAEEYEKNLATNTVQPMVESDYPASFTATATISLSTAAAAAAAGTLKPETATDQAAFHSALKHVSLHRLLPLTGRSGRHSKRSKLGVGHKGRTTPPRRRQTDSRTGTEDPQSPPPIEVVVHRQNEVQPPTYESLGSTRSSLSSTRTQGKTERLPATTDGTTNPIWLRVSGGHGSHSGV